LYNMVPYDFKAIEKKWQAYWELHQAYATPTDLKKPKYYILDMFPYPSGEGLHVGHLLGYISSDVVARYKRSKGYAVLHPMGFDAFGLPAEQYALQTGQHPAVTTEKNATRYKQQFHLLGLSYDWKRAISTTDPSYYRWTQWIFLALFKSWYDTALQKARPIEELVATFKQMGNQAVPACCNADTPIFTAQDWQGMDEKSRQQILLSYRLAFLEHTTVNWCPALGTVLANEEVKDGLSERGSHPVIRQPMLQWSLRITAYAERLLAGLEHIQWPSSTKEMQRHWIGKSTGAAITFQLTESSEDSTITVFTTRPDTLFGITYIALAPEHPLAQTISIPSHKTAVESYITTSLHRSERDRLAGAQAITGVFTGCHALHPFTQQLIPIWVADYVLAGYGTGAIIGVPAHDSRDYVFAKHFQLPIKQVVSSDKALEDEAYEGREGHLIHSQWLDGLGVDEATEKVIQELETLNIGVRKTFYRLRNTIFSRQRYWGEPLPIYYQEELPYALPTSALPLLLPSLTSYQPTGKPPLASAPNWHTATGQPLECNTMPSWAGSSWYFFRYMDPDNQQAFVGPAAQQYWKDVDLYIGGAEHTTGHLLYARFWTKFLHDRGYVDVEEPFQTLIHQGMVQNKAHFAYRIKGTDQFVSYHLRHHYETIPLYVANDLVDKDILQLEAFRRWRPDLHQATFILEDGKYICGSEVEKMSKSKYNTITPDSMVEQHGADTLRLYILFLGPIEQSKPWDTHGIAGMFRFLLKVWRLFHTPAGIKTLSAEIPAEEVIRLLHKTIKKVEEDIQRYAFNTAISTLMIFVNELTALGCTNRPILEKLLQLLAPFAPHMAEELWELLGHTTTITQVPFPTYNEAYLQEKTYEYPIAINGKVRTHATFSTTASGEEIKTYLKTSEIVQKWVQQQPIKKTIIIPNKMINIVL
jgi:leucyl-tRNA synthetase